MSLWKALRRRDARVFFIARHVWAARSLRYVIEILNISVLLGEFKNVSSFNESTDIAAGYVYCHVNTDAEQKCSRMLFIKDFGMDLMINVRSDLQHLMTRGVRKGNMKEGEGGRKEEVGRDE